MTDVHALSGAYAIDALDDAERAQFEQHLALCDDCRAEVASLQEAGAELATTTMTTPSAALRARVLADVAQVRPFPPVVPPAGVADLAAHRNRRRRPLLLAVAAAAVVAAVGVGAVVAQPWADEPAVVQALPDPTEAVLAASDAETHATDLPEVDGSATATVVRSRELGQAVIMTQNMPALPSSEVYQLWLRIDGDMEPAGLMTAADSTVLLEGDATDAEAIGVTVEPAGGSARPTTQPVAYVPLETA
ncbi:anti-sigma factor [Nocardioides sp. AX2bis]|uniref:anti-sigma factor n=1 Tax=Nocardioides sp. AX2bis TaxID=2653157 RepID=UPI0012EF5416|nr:anti-sigma factor [Nocardioides sp. AX2bis]VXB95184.1 putative Anti-sigma-K factor RskA [Nocardioides sp. AX2bis]